MECKHPGFVTGIAREAALIPKPLPVLCSGASSQVAYEAARKLASQGCDLLVSFGLAGGLDPALKSGDLLIPHEVIASGGEHFSTAGGYSFPNAITKPLAGSDDLLFTIEDKARLLARTGAAAVDMESHAVARAAKETGLPFLVLRAVADTSQTTLPSYIAKATAPDGGTRLGPILAGLARQPGTLFDLIALAKATNLAFASLKAALPVLFKN